MNKQVNLSCFHIGGSKDHTSHEIRECINTELYNMRDYAYFISTIKIKHLKDYTHLYSHQPIKISISLLPNRGDMMYEDMEHLEYFKKTRVKFKLDYTRLESLIYLLLILCDKKQVKKYPHNEKIIKMKDVFKLLKQNKQSEYQLIKDFRKLEYLLYSKNRKVWSDSLLFSRMKDSEELIHITLCKKMILMVGSTVQSSEVIVTHTMIYSLAINLFKIWLDMSKDSTYKDSPLNSFLKDLKSLI